MWLVTFVALLCGLVHVKGDISELDIFNDVQPLRIGAFNIQIFGETTFMKSEVRHELIKILSRYEIVLIQEIRDSSGLYLPLLVEEINKAKRQDEPFSLVVSERLGRSTSKEQYAYLFRKKYVHLSETYTYEDPLDKFERPPYCVKFHTDMYGMHEFGIIGLHAKPDDVFNELNELDRVYEVVSSLFATPNILIAGDLNADCSYINRQELEELSIRRNPAYTWLISDNEDTTVGSSSCAYDRFIVQGTDWLDNIVGVKIFYFEVEYQLPEELAVDVSDHYPIEIEIRGKCYRDDQSVSLTTITMKDERVIPSTDLSYIRYIYQKTDEKIPTWQAQVYKIDTRMNYVIAAKANVDVTQVVEEFFQFYEAFDRKLLSLESIAKLRKVMNGFQCFQDPNIYCVDTPNLSVVNLTVTCSLVDPLTCKMDVSRYLS